MDKNGVTIGVIGGIGLGLILGSEFSGRYITFIGAIMVTMALFSLAFLWIIGKKT